MLHSAPSRGQPQPYGGGGGGGGGGELGGGGGGLGEGGGGGGLGEGGGGLRLGPYWLRTAGSITARWVSKITYRGPRIDLSTTRAVR